MTGMLDGLAVLEQLMGRSASEQRCVECGAPGTVERRGALVPSVPRYFMCGECAAYWDERGRRDGWPFPPPAPPAQIAEGYADFPTEIEVAA